MKKLFTSLAVLVAITVSAFSFLACNGNDPVFVRDGVIQVITREAGSGTRSAFLASVFTGDDAITGGYANIVMPGTAGDSTSVATMRAMVGSNPQAIGFDSFGALSAAGDDSVRILSVGGVTPSITTVQNNTYSISRPFLVAHREASLMTPQAAEFLRFLSSSQAREIMIEEGFVPRSLATAPAFSQTAGVSGAVTIIGSSSVVELMGILAEEFEDITTGITIAVTGGGSGGGRSAIASGTHDFGMVSAVMSASHVTYISSNTPAAYTTFADDAVAVIVNAANPLTNITRAQLATIFNAEHANHIDRWTTLVPATNA